MDGWGINAARMRGRPFLLLVDGVEGMEGWRTLWDGYHAASGGGRSDDWMAWLDRNNPDASRRPRPRISACVSTVQRSGWLARVEGQHDHHMHPRSRRKGRTAAGCSPEARRITASGPMQGPAPTAADQGWGKSNGGSVVVDNQPTKLGARDRFLPHPRAPKKQTCAVNGGPKKRQLPHEVDLRSPLGTARGTFAYRWRCICGVWTSLQADVDVVYV